MNTVKNRAGRMVKVVTESEHSNFISSNDEENADMKERMTDIIVDLELEHNKVLSVLRIDYEKFKIWEDTMPFYKNIKEESVDVLGYIEKSYGIFHCEGDEVILEDITEFLEGKGMKINA